MLLRASSEPWNPSASRLNPCGMDTLQGGLHVSSTDVGQISPISVRVKQACKIIGIGRSKLYELIAAGEIETVKLAATLIPMASLVSLIEARRDACRR